ncbi:Aste57867_4346 [Aphanomyces stellatus]|uniref:Aste57867_4346 protein n=1 Tax=Aphanomyces stellatus TaxID=120398 RepID=A0A485KDP5_9STRA|nr:hypothetical protein As57867_004334 [Aphanomyces stellatus]VFT81460.1 Aste57867_4346 [Aphanomyces stellatus]
MATSNGQHHNSMPPSSHPGSQVNQGMDSHGNGSNGQANNGLGGATGNGHNGAPKGMGDNNHSREMGYYQGMHAYQGGHQGGGHSVGTRRQSPCPVCMSHTVPPNMVLEPCQHQFHYQCVDVFIQNDKVCPVCRVPIQRHQPLGRPAMAPPTPHGMHPEYQLSGMNSHYQAPSTNMHMNNAAMSQGNHHLHGGAQAPAAGSASSSVGHFASASLYELPPEVFLDNSYEQNAAMNASKMRKGKWTTEEAAYCDRLIEEFKNGNLPLAEGTTLRTFLSKLLNCDPMRISKKYTGNQCIGKIIFRRKSKEPTKDEIEATRKQLAELERIYLDRERMNQQRREKRLESEVNRDRSRLLAARNMVYTGGPPNAQGGAAAPPNMPMVDNNPGSGHGNNGYTPPQDSHQQHHQQQHQQLHHSLHQQHQHQQHHQHHQLHHHSHNGSSSLPPSHPPTKPPTAPKDAENTNGNVSIKAEIKSEKDKDGGVPRISSVDSFSSLFPRIASLDCFQGLTSLNRPPQPPPPPSQTSESTAPPPTLTTSVSSLFRSPSLECLNTIPRVNSLEQFSNFIANMPPEPKKPSSSSSPPKHNHLAKPPMADKPSSFPRVASLDRLNLPRAPSMDRLPRINSSEAFPHVPSLGSLSAFGSFSNLGALAKDKSHPSSHNLSSAISRNSSIEDILSLVAASSESDQHKKRKLQQVQDANAANADKKSRVL